MNRALLLTLVAVLPAALFAEPAAPHAWNDALSSAPVSDASPTLAMGDIRIRPGQNYEGTRAPEYAATMIVLDHLRHIRNSGMMSNTITQVFYWQQVFWHAGRPDLYEAGKPVVEVALRAGLQPYYDGEDLDAVRFSELAIQELTKAEIPAETPSEEPVSVVR